MREQLLCVLINTNFLVKMNYLEKLFFGLFLLFSRWKGEEELAGINALLLFGLVIFFNVLTIIVLLFALEIRFEFIDYMDSKAKWALFVIAWFFILGTLVLRRSQIESYRERLYSISKIESNRIKNKALVYCITSILIGVITAFTTNYIINY